MNRKLDIVIFGLSLSSSWGNGHATTYRALIRGLNEAGHKVTFLERDVEWYRNNRDLADPDFCGLHYYDALAQVGRMAQRLRRADAVIVGSYVPQGAALIDMLEAMRLKFFGFYDIDTPVTLAMLRRGEETHLRRDQVPLFDTYFSFSGGRALHRLRHEFGAADPVALYCAVDPALYYPQAGPQRWDLGYLGTYSPDRQPGLEALLIEPARQLPQMKFVIAGPNYPRDMDLPANVERIEHLEPGRHRAFYASQRFTLNLTRADMVALGWSASVRIFEAAACGTPIVSDRWEGLGELLPEDEAILIADRTSDVVEALTAMEDARRLAMARAARKLVLAGHTGAHRAAELVDAIMRHGSRGKANKEAGHEFQRYA
jgi:spore maturation protein CgeB